MPVRSAGILLYRRGASGPEVLLVHPGGPFWAKKDEGAWSIPKGEFEGAEDPLGAARREFEEELGSPAPPGAVLALEPLRQPSGKVIHAWAIGGDFDPSGLKSNAFTLEWPPRSGRRQEFPEVDRAAWFPLEDAARKIVQGQAALLRQLQAQLGSSTDAEPGGG